MMGTVHRSRDQRRPRGLTLVEMCLALVVFGMVTASIATVFIAASDLVEKGRGRTELVQAGRAAINRLLAELGTATEVGERSENYLRVYCAGTTNSGSFARWVEFWVEDGTLWRRVQGDAEQPLAEDVVSFETGGLTLWSKLSEPSDVIFPEIGPAGFFYRTPAWTPVYFGNGFASTMWSHRVVFFPTADVLDNARGTLEFWMRPEYSSELPLTYRDKYLVDTSGYGGKIELFFYYYARKIVFRMNGDNATDVRWEPTWAPNEVVHVALVWDCTGQELGGNRTMALYVNGLLREDATETNTWSPQEFGPYISLGMAEGVEAEAAFENLRVYDYCKTDFEDRYRQEALGLMRVRLVLEDDETGERFTIESGVPTR